MPKVVVELGVSEIGIGVPSALPQVVEHCDSRVPLRHLIERVGPAAHAESALTFDARYLEAPIRFDGRARVCGDWRGYGDADDGLSEDAGERSGSAWRAWNRSAQRIRYRQALSIHDEPCDFHSAGDDVHQVGTSRVRPEDVLIEPQYHRSHR